MNYKPEDVIPTISIDCIIFGLDQRKLKVLLVRRSIEPAKGSWALPGGFVLAQEDLDQSARRTLEDLTGLRQLYMEQVHTFGQVNRYPLRRVVTVAYYALINYTLDNLKAGPDTSDIQWCDILDLPELVFDHQHIL